MTPTIPPEDPEQNSNTQQPIPDWMERWKKQWLHKMECQGVDPKVRAGFSTEIDWLHGKILDTTEKDTYRAALEAISNQVSADSEAANTALIALNKYPSPKQQNYNEHNG